MIKTKEIYKLIFKQNGKECVVKTEDLDLLERYIRENNIQSYEVEILF
jgi:hypothetical protein